MPGAWCFRTAGAGGDTGPQPGQEIPVEPLSLPGPPPGPGTGPRGAGSGPWQSGQALLAWGWWSLWVPKMVSLV
jgi:hypothetical protein